MGRNDLLPICPWLITKFFFKGVHVSQFGPLFFVPFGVGSESPCPAELPTYIVFFSISSSVEIFQK